MRGSQLPIQLRVYQIEPWIRCSMAVIGEDGILEIHDINQESMNGQKNNSE